MQEKQEKTNKIKVNKGQLAVRIMGGILVILMLFSAFATVGYYLFSSLAN